MSRKQFFYNSALAFFGMGVLGATLVVFFGRMDLVGTWFLLTIIGTLLWVPAIIWLLLGLFAHSAEPFAGRETTSLTSAFLAAVAFLVLVGFLWHFAFLFW